MDSSGWSLNWAFAINCPWADAIIYATALANQAELITTDAYFSGLPGVTIL